MKWELSFAKDDRIKVRENKCYLASQVNNFRSGLPCEEKYGAAALPFSMNTLLCWWKDISLSFLSGEIT